MTMGNTILAITQKPLQKSSLMTLKPWTRNLTVVTMFLWWDSLFCTSLLYTVYIQGVFLPSLFLLINQKWAKIHLLLQTLTQSKQLFQQDYQSFVLWAVWFLSILQKYQASEWLFCPGGRLDRVIGQPTACSRSTSGVCLDTCQLNAVIFGF